MSDCLFCKIIRGDIPASKVYENEHVLAFRDISPVAPQHILLIPKTHVGSVGELEPEHAMAMGELFLAARQVAEAQGLGESGYRLVINNGPDAMQTVFHIHLHLLGGQEMGWPPFSKRLED
ncbi:MAG TPA: histidine triad nucleotide-binding protein [Calditrichia bacterium]|nr:histidine triad nucleotide-binding protein [Calditrichia bacterium]HQV32212.1 histidine triad nucleotide-binding protein [Calditrichia bacterium]